MALTGLAGLVGCSIESRDYYLNYGPAPTAIATITPRATPTVTERENRLWICNEYNDGYMCCNEEGCVYVADIVED